MQTSSLTSAIRFLIYMTMDIPYVLCKYLNFDKNCSFNAYMIHALLRIGFLDFKLKIQEFEIKEANAF